MSTITFEVTVPAGSYIPISAGAKEISLSNNRAVTIAVWAGHDEPPLLEGVFDAVGHKLRNGMSVSYADDIPVYATAIGREGILTVTATHPDSSA